MNTSETLRLKALKLKETFEGANSDLIDHVLASNPEQTAKSMRNICALIHPVLFDDVESICSDLRITKRQVVEMALVDFMVTARKVMVEVNPFENLPSQITEDDKNRALSDYLDMQE